MWKQYWRYLYMILACGLLGAGCLFEDPQGQRLWVLFSLALCLVIVMAFGLLPGGRLWSLGMSVDVKATLTTVMMAVILLVIEYYSKYAVNYFFHSIYILVIFFGLLQMPSVRFIGMSILVTFLSFAKFIELIIIQRTFANIALLVFFASVQMLMVVIGIFLRMYREETDKTNKLYGELLASHDQLKAYAEEISELSRVEAKQQIARDLHDTLGHELTGLIMQMEMAGNYFEEMEAAEGMAMLEASKASARESLVKVRTIVDTLKEGEASWSVEDLIEDFGRRTGCRIAYTSRGEGLLDQDRQEVLYRVVQECLTNAVRHGQASVVEVTVILGSDEVSFEISNNGLTSDAVVEGNGLTGMRERVREVGGRISVEGRPEFRLWGTIPYKETET